MGVESVPEVIPDYEFQAGIPSLVKVRRGDVPYRDFFCRATVNNPTLKKFGIAFTTGDKRQTQTDIFKKLKLGNDRIETVSNNSYR